MSSQDLETSPQESKTPPEHSLTEESVLIAKPGAQAEGAETASRQIARATGIVMFAFILTSLIGVAHQVVITDAFGTSAALDSFNAANRITELLFNLVAGGALGSAFIPMFTGFLTRDDKRGAWRLASGVVNIVFLVLIAVSVIAWIFAPWIVKNGLYALTADSNIGQLDVTVRLLRIMLPTVVIFGMSGLVMGMLNAHRSFLIPALAPAMYSLGIIFGTLALPKNWGVDRLAVGVLIGAGGHLLLQLPSLFRLPERAYHAAVGLKDKAVRQVLKLMLPRLIGAGVVQLNFVANTIIALSLGEGAASAVVLAFTLMMMPQRAIAQSAGIASLPTLSAQAELGQYAQMRATIAKILRGMILLALPASAGLILLRVPLVRVLYERGEFSPESTRLVAWALLWYAAGLVGHSLVEVLSRAFYALHDTRTPVIIGVGAMSLNIALSFLLAAWFRSIGWMPHGGLALANSAATGLESLLLLVLLRRRLQGMEGRRILHGTAAALAASALMSLAVFGWLALLPDDGGITALLGGMGIGVLAYALALKILRVPELDSILTLVQRKLHLKKRRI